MKIDHLEPMFLELPLELIVHTLCKLGLQDLLACRLTSKYLDTIICESVVLQHSAALAFAKAKDNPNCSLLVSEKLQALQFAEKAWSFVRPGFTKSVPISFIHSGLYDLRDGVFVLSNSTRTSLHHLGLPRTESGHFSWKTIESKKKILSTGLFIYEHDLIVLVTSTPDQANIHLPTRFKIGLDLLEFSTGNPHPRALESCNIHVMYSESDNPYVGIEIAGNHLVLVISFITRSREDDHIFIFDWQKNFVITSFHAPSATYSDILFLAENLILLPNRRLNALEVFRIPPTPTVGFLAPILVLDLPMLAHGHLLGIISSRAAPNPIGTASHEREESHAGDQLNSSTASDSARASRRGSGGSSQQRGFGASAEDAICIFDLRIFTFLGVGGVPIGLEARHRLTFLVHRTALVALVTKHCQGSEVVKKLWAEWGPPITRWFNSDGFSELWITSTAGQRHVRMQVEPSGTGIGAAIYVLDFNQANVRRIGKYEGAEGVEKGGTSRGCVLRGESGHESQPAFRQESDASSLTSTQHQEYHNTELEEETRDKDSGMELSPPWSGSRQLDSRTRIWYTSATEGIQSAGIFSERVIGLLPYVECASEAQYTFDTVILDEERVIGLNMNGISHNIENIEILYFG